MISGRLKADGLALLEIDSISFLAGSANPKMRGRFAFVKSKTGATLGFTEHENWSTNTLKALASLRECMERDVAAIYMEGGESATTASGSTQGAPPGLGELLNQNEAPSI